MIEQRIPLVAVPLVVDQRIPLVAVPLVAIPLVVIPLVVTHTMAASMEVVTHTLVVAITFYLFLIILIEVTNDYKQKN